MPEDLRLAIVVNPELPLGLIANTVGAIAIGIGAAAPELAARRLADRQERSIDISSDRPVPVLQADHEAIRALTLKALALPCRRIVVAFPAFARAFNAYADYEAAFPGRDLAEETIDGFGLAGASKWVRSLTGSLKLLR